MVDADVGKAIKVQVSFTDDAGNAEELTSEPCGGTGEMPRQRINHGRIVYVLPPTFRSG